MARNKKKRRPSSPHTAKPSPLQRPTYAVDDHELVDAPGPLPSSESDKMPTVSPLLLTCAEVCKLLSVSRSTLDRLGETVPGRVKLGGQVRYHRETLENWLLDQVRS